jgi:hypothetical protein
MIDSSQREVNMDSSIFRIEKINEIYPNTSGANFSTSYIPELPYSINIFTAISKSFVLDTITDPLIEAKLLQLLNALNEAIINIPDVNNIERYLSKLHLVEQEDKSILIEWNYQNFRIGFVVCKPIEDSYYFFVLQDTDSFFSESYKIKDNVNLLARRIINYIIRNT